ncbi:Ectonucleotide pyrophosphatase/phosphodiesterase family member 7 [Galemys pyrenaicus]|uniref:Ectonucleotide pyrophosphatase/phosphodiesterase family member 7 n=1 Tax=Galemys pyrenaicus TaxID=202257 RepID=A0A8J6E5G2_GALPY|nr:Ectonucleotide pyrophosphatase/phosphodiesterase family member 7 [Galemys pyrenaicus]KAG8524919.1 Ectonucleotide pyrophosphatase/phosphodiesterase family member 7 [Galemys pyrenaicus]
MTGLRSLALLLPLLLGWASGHPAPGRRSFHKLLLISFDGFRWDYDQDVDTPNMDRLVKEGVKAKYLSPPFVTMTSPSHFTTISGDGNGAATKGKMVTATQVLGPAGPDGPQVLSDGTQGAGPSRS